MNGYPIGLLRGIGKDRDLPYLITRSVRLLAEQDAPE